MCLILVAELLIQSFTELCCQAELTRSAESRKSSAKNFGVVSPVIFLTVSYRITWRIARIAEKYNLLAGNLGIELDDEDGAWITTGDIYDIPEGETMEEASVLETSHAGREQYKILYNEICQATRRKGSSTRRDRTERLNEGFARQTKAMVEAYMDWSYRTREGGLESCLAPDARDASAQGTSTIILLDIFRTYTCHVFLSRVFTKTQQKQM